MGRFRGVFDFSAGTRIMFLPRSTSDHSRVLPSPLRHPALYRNIGAVFQKRDEVCRRDETLTHDLALEQFDHCRYFRNVSGLEHELNAVAQVREFPVDRCPRRARLQALLCIVLDNRCRDVDYPAKLKSLLQVFETKLDRLQGPILPALVIGLNSRFHIGEDSPLEKEAREIARGYELTLATGQNTTTLD